MPDLEVSDGQLEKEESRNDLCCTVIRCRTLGWLSNLVNAEFGHFRSSSVTSRGSVWMRAHARARHKVFSMLTSKGAG